jgi:hypothetical protein
MEDNQPMIQKGAELVAQLLLFRWLNSFGVSIELRFD